MVCVCVRVLWSIWSETNKYTMFETPAYSYVQHQFFCNLTNLSHIYNLVFFCESIVFLS